MKILFLGTGAADWEIKCEEDTLPGERRRSSMIIDESILLDVAPQSYAFAKRLGVNMSKITDCFITHSHVDHYNKSALLNFAKDSGNKINLYCHKGALPCFDLSDDEAALFNICPLEAFDIFDAAGYKVTAVSANHLVADSSEQPLHYILAKDGRSYMCGGDGGLFTAHTWEYMRTLCFDGIIFDLTVGDMTGNFRLCTHNSIPMLRMIISALRENEMIHDGTVLIANHLAQTLHCEDQETERILGEIGVKVAYDGITIEM